MEKPRKPTIEQLNYARSLAGKLGAESKYQWSQDYWTEEELLTLIYGLEKRVKELKHERDK